MEPESEQVSPRLRAARLLGATCLALLGPVALRAEHGAFGPIDDVHLFGTIYAIAFAVAAAAHIGGHFARKRWARPLTYFLYVANIGVFSTAIISDPVTAGLLVLWHLVLIARSLLPDQAPLRPPPDLESQPNAASASRDWIARTGPAAAHLILLSIFVTVAVVGYQLAAGLLALLTCFALNLITAALVLPFLIAEIRAGKRMVAVIFLPLITALLFAGRPVTSLTWMLVFQVMTMAYYLSKGPVATEIAAFLLRRTALLTVISFILVCLIGTLLLTFPGAAAPGTTISALDALFTSTSATCVTGLIVLDTPHAFSPFGQAVILGLIQIGGLGIMVLSTFAILLLGGKLGLRQGHSMANILDLTGPRSAVRLTLFIVVSTFAIELVGAALLLPSFLGKGLSFAESAWRAAFHSISAFCNAGFALQSDSLIMFQDDPYTLAVFMALITLGGIGFLVIASAWWRIRGQRNQALWFHARVAAWMTLILTLLGFIVIAAVEWDASLHGLSVTDRLANALFQSVTLRTAGFNSVAMANQQQATGMFMQLLMFIGASPGGTGGGIKTTTLLVLLLSVSAIIRGQTRVTIRRRTIPVAIVLRSTAIALMAAGLGFLALFALLMSHDLPFEQLSFEVFSALGTVGLSLGATASLEPIGRLVIIILMLAGRVGPLTVALLLSRTRETKARYAETRIMVG